MIDKVIWRIFFNTHTPEVTGLLHFTTLGLIDALASRFIMAHYLASTIPFTAFTSQQQLPCYNSIFMNGNFKNEWNWDFKVCMLAIQKQQQQQQQLEQLHINTLTMANLWKIRV